MYANGTLSAVTPFKGVTKEKGFSSLPTPNTMDYLPQRDVQAMSNLVRQRPGRKRLSNLREAVNPTAVKMFNELQANGNQPDICSIQTGSPTQLNPQFLELMLGFPINYTKTE